MISGNYCDGCSFKCIASDCECICHGYSNPFRFGKEMESRQLDLSTYRRDYLVDYCRAFIVDEDTLTAGYVPIWDKKRAFIKVRNNTAVVLSNRVKITTVRGDDSDNEVFIDVDIDTIVEI